MTDYALGMFSLSFRPGQVPRAQNWASTAGGPQAWVKELTICW